jgi:hypothetical protein
MMQGRTLKVVYLRRTRAALWPGDHGRDKLKTAGVDQIGFVYVLPHEKGGPR